MRSRGSIAVYIILMSTSIFIILLGLLRQASVVFTINQESYYQRLAEEAAEAGAAYASSCLDLNNRSQTWGGAQPDLTQTTDCDGSAASPAPDYVYESSNIRTSFTVGDLEFSDYFSAIITSTGYTELIDSSDNVVDTYQHTSKKTIVWSTNYQAQRSVSGTYRTCAIISGTVYCWGYNRFGQLGNGESIGLGSPEDSSSVDSLIPVKVKQETGVLAGKTVTDMFSAQWHSCALADGKVYCWGYNRDGQLGNGVSGINEHSNVPVEVGGALAGKTVTDVGGSGNTSCAIAEGKIYCWGLNDTGATAYGLVGVNNGGTTWFDTPQAVYTNDANPNALPSDYTATQIQTSGSRGYNLCAIADDKVYCWGNNNQGSVGDGTTTNRLYPTKVAQQAGALLGKRVVGVSQDGIYVDDGTYSLPHACALATEMDGSNGRVYCWGDNEYGQIGDGTTTNSSVPVPVRANPGDALFGKTIVGLEAGLYHTCVVADDDQAYCWGRNHTGQLGNNTFIGSTTPVAVSQLSGGLLGKTVVNIGGGSNRGCAITTEAHTYCWGRNTEGQIGDGTQTDRNIPTEALFLRPGYNQYIY